MNSYVGKMKAAIIEYQTVAKATAARIAEAESVYKPEEAQKVKARLLGELAEARKRAGERIESARDEGMKAAESWGTLDGSRITADAELLKTGTVKPKQFAELVDKYQDNSTMLHLLGDYAEKKNADGGGFARAWGWDGGRGEYEYFDTSRIPTVDGRQKELGAASKRAMSIVECLSDFSPGQVGRGPNNAWLASDIQTFGQDA